MMSELLSQTRKKDEIITFFRDRGSGSLPVMLGYWVHDLDPFLWRWSEDWGIRYYGLAYVAGFLAVYFGFRYFRLRGMSELDRDQEGSLLTWLVLGTLIGGRLGYCLMYDFSRTLADPVSIIAFWRGGIQGMASHGGIIGVALAALFFALKHRLEVWRLFDNLAVWAPVGIFLGRIANFINGELWGRPTGAEWGVVFPAAGDGIPRHPSQLYEALGEGLILFLAVWWHRHHRSTPGTTSVLFLLVYALVRIAGEQFREPDAHIGYLWGGFTQGQLLSAGLITVSLVLYLVIYFRKAGESRRKN